MWCHAWVGLCLYKMKVYIAQAFRAGKCSMDTSRLICNIWSLFTCHSLLHLICYVSVTLSDLLCQCYIFWSVMSVLHFLICYVTQCCNFWSVISHSCSTVLYIFNRPDHLYALFKEMYTRYAHTVLFLCSYSKVATSIAVFTVHSCLTGSSFTSTVSCPVPTLVVDFEPPNPVK